MSGGCWSSEERTGAVLADQSVCRSGVHTERAMARTCDSIVCGLTLRVSPANLRPTVHSATAHTHTESSCSLQLHDQPHRRARHVRGSSARTHNNAPCSLCLRATSTNGAER